MAQDLSLARRPPNAATATWICITICLGAKASTVRNRQNLVCRGSQSHQLHRASIDRTEPGSGYL